MSTERCEGFQKTLFLCTNTKKMIQAKNLHKYYDKLHVLKGVDLHIKKGEIVSIVGASGAGKTTLLQILGTLDKPTIENGTSLKINDVDVLKLSDGNTEKKNPKKKTLWLVGVLLSIYALVFAYFAIFENILANRLITRTAIGVFTAGLLLFFRYFLTKDKNDKRLSHFRNTNLGFIFQFHQLLPEFTALENVCIPGYIANRDKKEVETEAKRLLEYLGLSHRINHKPGELSGGEQQRVAVARSLINKPAVIFADEPSGNLDTASAENLHQLFFKLRDEFGQTFVIVTHNEELANMADRKLVMSDGLIP